jgi:hypothetical protein
MNKSVGALVTSINCYVTGLSITLLSFTALLSSAMSASAASRGFTASCSFVSATRQNCNIPVLSANFNAEIHFVSMQCTGTVVPVTLQQFKILAVPPNDTSDVAYQVAGNRASVGGVVTAEAITSIHVKLNTTSSAVIDFAPAPSGTTSCTVSISATF